MRNVPEFGVCIQHTMSLGSLLTKLCGNHLTKQMKDAVNFPAD